LHSPSFNFAVPDTGAFVWACNDDMWNNNLIGRVLQRVLKTGIECESIDPGHSAAAIAPSSTTKGRRSRRCNSQGIVDGVLSLLQRDEDAFVINSYLPPLQAVALSMRLGHVPQRRRSPAVQSVAANISLRAESRVDSPPREGFAGFAHDMLLELLPTCFFEGFSSLERQVAETGWPRRPRLIFTSNSFDTSEIFKLWAAERVEDGCPYITGQHGNNYGTARYCPSEAECVATSDAFVTWGWQGDDPKYVPAFIFKTAGQSRGGWNPQGGLLLIEVCLPHRLSAWDPYPEFAVYQEEQFRFVANLPETVRQTTTVRLHAEYKKQPWCEEERWRRREPSIALDKGTASISALTSASRLIVHSYDSTGILETLSLNIPTLCFWNGGLEHVRECAVPFYELLSACGILHDTPESAARKVAEVWNDIGSWWTSDVVQKARTRFCERYARVSPAPATELAALLSRIRTTKDDVRQ